MGILKYPATICRGIIIIIISLDDSNDDGDSERQTRTLATAASATLLTRDYRATPLFFKLRGATWGGGKKTRGKNLRRAFLFFLSSFSGGLAVSSESTAQPRPRRPP